jgi:CheY-like chemotaxis protein
VCNQSERSFGQPKPEAVKQGRVLRVLIVDDNTDAAESLAMLLRLWGHVVYMAHDGLAALAMARTYLPEVVLLDLGLPGMDGYEVARQLRAAGRVGSPGGPALWALTGYGQEEDRRRCKEAGFDRHLLKPVDLDALEVLLAQSEWLVEHDAKLVGEGSIPTAA